MRTYLITKKTKETERNIIKNIWEGNKKNNKAFS
jgi:hypothetical protein